MSRLPFTSSRHDPFWGMDGKGARNARTQRRLVWYAGLVVAVAIAALIATRLPSVDPQFVMVGGGRPILAGAIFALLGASVLIGAAWMRRGPRD